MVDIEPQDIKTELDEEELKVPIKEIGVPGKKQIKTETVCDYELCADKVKVFKHEIFDEEFVVNDEKLSSYFKEEIWVPHEEQIKTEVVEFEFCADELEDFDDEILDEEYVNDEEQLSSYVKEEIGVSCEGQIKTEFVEFEFCADELEDFKDEILDEEIIVIDEEKLSTNTRKIVNKNKRKKKVHNLRKRRERFLKCACCAKKSSRHICSTSNANNNQVENFNCTSCQKSFDNIKSLMSHMRSHTLEKPYTCSECKKTYISKQTLFQHIRSDHRGLKCYSCFQCEKSFTDKLLLFGHIMDRSSHTPLKTLTCSLCQLMFLNKYYLLQHIRIHLPYPCTRCGSWFDKKKSLSRHHCKNKGKRHSCAGCGKSYVKKSSLKHHVNKNTECQAAGLACEKSLLEEGLEKNMEIKHIRKLHECFGCGKFYSRITDLKKHVSKHTQCQTAGPVAGTPPLEKNLKNKKNKRPRAKRRNEHKCTHCGKCFLRVSDLKQHFLMHTGDKPYKCKNCDAAFSEESALVIHNLLEKSINQLNITLV